MTFPEISMRLARDGRLTLLERWDQSSLRTKAQVKTVVLVAAVAGAYHYSLSSLVQTIGFDTPLAYVGLVPLLAATLAWLRRRPAPGELSIHDRQLDYIIGLPLVAIATVMDFVLPAHMGDLYWVDRVDLLSLPIFVAGAVSLLFGTRVLWRQKVAVLYLVLAWPWPYSTVLLGTLGGFTDVTLRGLTFALRYVHVAASVPGAVNAGLFTVSNHGRTFPVDVVTACSGIDGMVGFFLVGAGFVTLVRGPVVRKAVWLTVGLGLLWVTNIGRLLLIFWVGQRFGEHIAIGIVHPVAGIVIFCLGIVAMMAMLRPFRLHFVDLGAPVDAPPAGSHTQVRQAAPKIFLAGGLVGVLGILLAINNSTLRSFDPVASASGEAKIASFIAHQGAPAGWQATYDTTYTINKPLFGQSSLWDRYLYAQSTDHAANDLGSSLPVTADVVDAGGLSGFEQYGVTACYSFHGYQLRDVAGVALGNGVTGQALSYASLDGKQDWTVVYWIVPVKLATITRYERVILYLQNSQYSRVSVPGAAPDVTGLAGALREASPADRSLIANRAFLVEFARQMIAAQVRQQDTSTTLVAITQAHAIAAPTVSGVVHAPQAVLDKHYAQIRKLEREGKLVNGFGGIYIHRSRKG